MSDYVPLKPITGPDEQPLPPQQSLAPRPPKKSNVFVWVLAGCGALIVIWVIAGSLFSGGYVVSSAIVAIPRDGEFFIGRDKVAQADIPTRIRNILKDKPGEILKDKPGEIVKSGKEVKYGTVVSVIDSIRDAGFSVKLPDWFPSFPGAIVQGPVYTESKDGERAYFGFSTNDSIEKVVKFYEENLKRAGLKVTTNRVQQKGVVTKGSLSTEDGDKKRTASVTAISGKGQTQVTIVFASK